MTEPAAKSPAPDEPAAAPASANRKRYALERRIVGVVYLALVGALIVHGSVEIYRDAFFRLPAAPSPFATCSAGIRSLYTDFARELASATPAGDRATPRRPATDPAVARAVARLDQDLLALRAVCAREGPAARDAYDSLTLWRHQAQDLARLEERVLAEDAERALRYQSPSPQHPPGNTP